MALGSGVNQRENLFATNSDGPVDIGVFVHGEGFDPYSGGETLRDVYLQLRTRRGACVFQGQLWIGVSVVARV
jgi:hypothetical protein